MNSQNLNIVPRAAPNNASLSAVYTDVIGALLQLPRKRQYRRFYHVVESEKRRNCSRKGRVFCYFFFKFKDS